MTTPNTNYSSWSREDVVKELLKRTAGSRPSKFQIEVVPTEKFIAVLQALDDLGPAKKPGTGGGGEAGPVKRFGVKAFQFVSSELKGQFSIEEQKEGIVVRNGSKAYQLQVNPAGAYSLKSL